MASKQGSGYRPLSWWNRIKLNAAIKHLRSKFHSVRVAAHKEIEKILHGRAPRQMTWGPAAARAVQRKAAAGLRRRAAGLRGVLKYGRHRYHVGGKVYTERVVAEEHLRRQMGTPARGHGEHAGVQRELRDFGRQRAAAYDGWQQSEQRRLAEENNRLLRQQQARQQQGARQAPQQQGARQAPQPPRMQADVRGRDKTIGQPRPTLRQERQAPAGPGPARPPRTAGGPGGSAVTGGRPARQPGSTAREQFTRAAAPVRTDGAGPEYGPAAPRSAPPLPSDTVTRTPSRSQGRARWAGVRRRLARPGRTRSA